MPMKPAGTVEEKTLDEFYSREDRRDVYLIERSSPSTTPWWVIRYSDQGNMLGFTDEAAARKAFRNLKMQAQNP